MLRVQNGNRTLEIKLDYINKSQKSNEYLNFDLSLKNISIINP